MSTRQRPGTRIAPHRYSSKGLKWFLNERVAGVLETAPWQAGARRANDVLLQTARRKGSGNAPGQFLPACEARDVHRGVDSHRSADIGTAVFSRPGSHRCDMLCPESKTDRWMNTATPTSANFRGTKSRWLCRVERGQTMFFGGNLIHGSGPNRTGDRWRRTFIGHYIDEASGQVAKFYHPVLNMRERS